MKYYLVGRNVLACLCILQNEDEIYTYDIFQAAPGTGLGCMSWRIYILAIVCSTLINIETPIILRSCPWTVEGKHSTQRKAA